jgi:4-hydroxy-tetrahydrodipicolinate reductase
VVNDKMTINVMMAGLPGKVSTIIARRIDQTEDMQLLLYALAGGTHDEYTKINDRVIKLIKSEKHTEFLSDYLINKPFIIVDFTQPDAVNRNAELYCTLGIPFVMGTTGGDRSKLEETVKNSFIPAVIAPNMNPALVVVQAMLTYAAETFPGALEGFLGKVSESHQKAKKDRSGTGVAWQGLLEKLGVNFPLIMESIRDREDAHGYHFIHLTRGGVSIDLTTKVEGRVGYDDGTLMAIRYLDNKIKERRRNAQGQVYTMIDVLKGA